MMTKMEHRPPVLAADRLASLIHRRMGLIVGPGLTLGENSVSRIRAAALHDLSQSEQPVEAEFRSFDDLQLNGTYTADQIRNAVRNATLKTPPNPQVQSVVRHRWAAVLSLSLDSAFDTAYREWCNQQPVGPSSVTVVSKLRALHVPSRSTPVFKLVGSIFDDDFPITRTQERVRVALWPQVLRAFADAVQGSAVLCVGLSEDANLLTDLFAPLLADPRLVPGPLIMLSGDPVCNSLQVRELEQSGLRVHRVEADLGTLLRISSAQERAGYTMPFLFSQAQQTFAEELATFAEMAVLVPAIPPKTAPAAAKESNRLRELLFSPTIPNWEPFAADLDFPRAVTATIVDKIKSLSNGGYWGEFELRVGGAASVGKTTVLKRAALELARQGRSVIWLRHYPYQDGPKMLKDLFAKVETSRHATDIVVVVDDPIGLGTIRLEDIRTLLTQVGKPAVLVTGVRTTDLATADNDLEDNVGYALTEVTIPDIFDVNEWASLPKYLYKLHVYATEAEAQIEVNKAASKSATDVLSALYYLLPETRSRISDSLRGEYTRLGDRASLRNLIIGGYNRGADLLKRTYDYVAVASKYHAPVPMEVLVSALGQDYESWRNMTQQDGLAFGLFYQEESVDAESVTFRTRNDVVSDIIVTYINGGVGVRGGEMACLKELLGACNGTAPAYRDFCHRILLPPKERGEERPPLFRLDHAERIALFDVAIASLPVEDPVLLHHKGIWEGRSGDTASARQTFDRAIKAKPYPYSMRIEAPEHIHTSAAANEVRSIKNGQIDRDEGKRNALHHLERASSTYFFNASAIHTKARLVAELADLTQGSGEPDADWFDMIAWALSDLDRSMLQLKTEFAGPKERKDIEMLDQAREEILNRCLRLGDDVKAAEDLWNQFRSQEGFAVVGRRLFVAAQQAGKDAGTLFKRAFDYCQECLTKVLHAGAEPAASLVEVQLHIYFQWQVRRRVMSGGTEEINWKMIEAFASRLTRSIRTEGDPFYRYLSALAEAHLGDWAKANSTFEALRRGQAPPWLLHEPRDYLMNAKGGMRKVQGTVTRAGSERFLKVDELGQDFRIARSGTWPLDGDISHAYVRFSYAGPLAVQEE